MKKSIFLKVGDIVSYRLEYLKRGGDFVTIDSLSKRRLLKRIRLLSAFDSVVYLRLFKVFNGVRFVTLLRRPDYTLFYDSDSCK